ncbi:Chromosomal replication initiator protein DnaA [Anaerovibrio sp. JC8]|uniref:chromosomal replication initiator protein DnaA n=1 Tax=Anaerovibrio sp. JC8 TaxID=1240085 RepID=UPI000A0E50B6|nr:chromosomal replication initiator protein DnaA [Anaerovibrio sp. JC8]ORU01140.1 Chromosomal replication initiator protein DnaA [Anaerovibrio sp. JC8]
MNQEQLKEIWDKIIAELKNNLAPAVIENWFSMLKPVSLENNVLTISTPHEVTKQFIDERYKTIIQDACKNALNMSDISYEIVVVEENQPEKEEPVESLFTENEGQPVSASSYDTPSQIAPGDVSSLNPKYVFDTLVAGSFNRIAYAAAQAVAKDPGKNYNPLFMYGGVGLGKTHLMHAIGHEVLKNDPNKRVLYITSEKFTNELINAIGDKTTEAFRQKYRNIDLLMVDDIQFLSKKIQTQEEFFHTFNALHQANKQIVLSSDRPPHEIQDLEKRLSSRFAGGMLTDIQPPELETRIAILKKKTEAEKIDIPNEALVYIASRIDNNIRELEGALTRVVAYSELIGEKITTDLVADTLKDVYPDNHSKEITMDVIQEVVANHFNLKIDDLNSSKRTKALAYPRQIAMYLCRELTNNSLPQIGDFFGGRDHTTVLHACNKITEDKGSDSKLNNTLQELTKRIERL